MIRRDNNINKKTLCCDCMYIYLKDFTCTLRNRMHPAKIKCKWVEWIRAVGPLRVLFAQTGRPAVLPDVFCCVAGRPGALSRSLIYPRGNISHSVCNCLKTQPHLRPVQANTWRTGGMLILEQVFILRMWRKGDEVNTLRATSGS
jgi:hypothetical protein